MSQYTYGGMHVIPPDDDEDEVSNIFDSIKQDDPKFSGVLEQISLAGITTLASRVRKTTQLKHETSTTEHSEPGTTDPFDCKVVLPPLHGSYNIAFKILFEDGVQWLLKIPANGYAGAFDSLDARALESEALTMRLIKGKTSIPVPAVINFHAGMDNYIGCPYILMEFVKGTPLSRLWFDREASVNRLECIRNRALQTIALAMAQLCELRTPHAGSLRFDTDQNAIGVGPAKVIDAVAMVQRVQSEGNNDDDQTQRDIFCEKGPLQDPVSSILFMLNHRGIRPGDNVYDRGVFQSLRLFTEWAFDRTGSRDIGGDQFALAHPDFDLQNLLVEEDGTLCGIIDWDGVAAEPLSIGCLAYPKWLIRDWDPNHYNLDISTGERIDDQGFPENFPEELAEYRMTYAQYLEMALSLCPGSRRYSKQLADMTRSSIVSGTLAAAVDDPGRIPRIMIKVFEEMEMIENTFNSLRNGSEAGDPAENKSIDGDEREKDRDRDETNNQDQEDLNAMKMTQNTVALGSTIYRNSTHIVERKATPPWLGSASNPEPHSFRRSEPPGSNVRLDSQPAAAAMTSPIGLGKARLSTFALGFGKGRHGPVARVLHYEDPNNETNGSSRITGPERQLHRCNVELTSKITSICDWLRDNVMRAAGFLRRIIKPFFRIENVFEAMSSRRDQLVKILSQASSHIKNGTNRIIQCHLKTTQLAPHSEAHGTKARRPTPDSKTSSGVKKSAVVESSGAGNLVACNIPGVGNEVKDDIDFSEPDSPAGTSNSNYPADKSSNTSSSNSVESSEGVLAQISANCEVQIAVEAGLPDRESKSIEEGPRATVINEGEHPSYHDEYDNVGKGKQGEKKEEEGEEEGEEGAATEDGFCDNGGLMMVEICVALGKDQLDEKRMDRLKNSFTMLIDWTMGRW